MRIRVVVSVVLLMGAATACTGGGTSASPSGQVTSTTRPLRFGAEPLWSAQTKGAPRSAARFTLHGDSVVMFNGPKTGKAYELYVRDAATGRARWSARMWRPLPGGHGDRWNGAGSDDAAPVVVDRGGGWGVLVVTTRRSAARQKPYGLALLDGEDGHVVWRRKLVGADRTPAHGRYLSPGRLLTDGAHAVVMLRPSLGGTGREFRLAAVDVRTGARLWTRDRVTLDAVVAGSVVGVELPDAPILNDTGTGPVTVLDAATGRTRWSRSVGARGRMTAVAGGLLLLRERQGGTSAAPVLDLVKGTELGRMPAQIGACVDDRTTLIACEVSSPESRLYTIGTGDRKVRVSAHAPPKGMGLTFVRDGRIFYSGLFLPGRELDRAGTPLAGRLPEDHLLALSGRYAVVGAPAVQSYRVYGVG